MKVKFNRFERIAGVFVMVALVSSFVVAIGIAVQKGWFSSKVKYFISLDSADGIHAGTVVQVAGLRAGSVTEIELLSANQIKVSLEIYEKFKNKIKSDSSVQVVRPFIIGEKAIEISVGSEHLPVHDRSQPLPVLSSFDIMDLVSGKKMAPFLGTIEQLTANLKVLAEAFADRGRVEALVKTFDRLDPLVRNLNGMSVEVIKLAQQVNKDKRLEKVILPLAQLVQEINRVVPQITKENPKLGQELAQVISNLNHLTFELGKLTPAIAAVAPELPKTSLRAVEALNEAVVLLKAMQKSFFLRGNVDKVKQEERQRLPANENPTENSSENSSDQKSQ